GADVATGFLGGAFFAVMPVHTGVLNNIVGRADLIASTCMLAAVLLHAASLRSVNPAQPNSTIVMRRTGALLLAFLALGAKENGLSVVFMLPLIDILLSQRDTRSFGELVRRLVGTITRVWYLAIPVAAYFLLRVNALEGNLFQKPTTTKTVNMIVDSPLWQHVLGVFQLWGMYWYKMFWPAVLSVNYSINGVRLATSPANPFVLLGLLVTASLIILSIRAWRRGDRSPAFFTLAIVLSYFPTSNSLVLIQVFFAERLWYLPSIFASVLLASYAKDFLASRFGWTVVLVCLAGMSLRTLIRNSEWQHNGTLYASALRDFPEAIGANYAFGRWLVSSSDDPEVIAQGIPYLLKATEIDPGFTDAHRVLGNALYALRRYPEAVHHLQIADMQVPDAPKTVAILEAARSGLLQQESGRLELARTAARNAPQDLNAQLAYIDQLRNVGLLDEAFSYQQSVDHLFAQDALWHHQFAITLVLRDEPDAALERYRRAIAISATDPRLLLEAAMLLLERREGDDLKEADTLVSRAEAVAPGASAVLQARAELLALQGDLGRAITVLRQAIEALPDDSPHRRVLRNRLITLGG
ncbi:MAG: tetratricopeptide repeat protein, partial [Phycisphaerae bacterium]